MASKPNFEQEFTDVELLREPELKPHAVINALAKNGMTDLAHKISNWAKTEKSYKGAHGTVIPVDSSPKSVVKLVLIAGNTAYSKFRNEVAVLKELERQEYPYAPKLLADFIFPYAKIFGSKGTLYLGGMQITHFDYTYTQYLSRIFKRSNPADLTPEARSNIENIVEKLVSNAKEGLSKLHQAGFCHMDANTNNFMITREGKTHTTKVVDFERSRRIITTDGEKMLEPYPYESGPSVEEFEEGYDFAYFIFHLNRVLSGFMKATDAIRAQHDDLEYYVDLLVAAFSKPRLVYWIGISLDGPPVDQSVVELTTAAFDLVE